MGLVESTKTELDWEAPDFDLKGTDGKNYSLTDFVDKKGLLVIFTCNHCPYSEASWPLLVELYEKYQNDINFVAINPNDDSMYPEDSFEEMIKTADRLSINFPYLRDETQEIAKAYDAQCTPDLYLFETSDKEPKLFYRGRINDNWQYPEEVKEKNLEEAIDKLIAGDNPPTNQPPSMGCSIKWKL